MNEGKVLVFGPVLDPKGTYGLRVIRVAEESELVEFIKNDPAGSINTFEYFPMLGIAPN